MRHQGSPPGLLFRLVVPATVIFIITIFAVIVAPYSDQRAPLWQWLDRNADRLLLAEFVAVILLSLFAMAWDRRQILKQTPRDAASLSEAGEDSNDGTPEPQTPAARRSPAGNEPDRNSNSADAT